MKLYITSHDPSPVAKFGALAQGKRQYLPITGWHESAVGTLGHAGRTAKDLLPDVHGGTFRTCVWIETEIGNVDLHTLLRDGSVQLDTAAPGYGQTRVTFDGHTDVLETADAKPYMLEQPDGAAFVLERLDASGKPNGTFATLKRA